MLERRFRSLTAMLGMDYFREEGVARPSDLSGSSEWVLQTVIPELHVSELDGGWLSFALSNPLQYGPVVVVHGGHEDMLAPGETLTIDELTTVIFAKAPGVIEMILLGYADTFPMLSANWPMPEAWIELRRPVWNSSLKILFNDLWYSCFWKVRDYLICYNTKITHHAQKLMSPLE